MNMLATGLLIAALYLSAENAPPSPDHIRILQEAHARERARAIRAVPPVRHRLPFARSATKLSEAERAALKAALERFVREHAGEPVVDLHQVRP